MLGKIANIVTILGLPLALVVLIFGDNLFEQATGKSFFQFFTDYSVSAIDKAVLGTSCIFFIIGLFFTSVSRFQPQTNDSYTLVMLGVSSSLGAFVLFLLFLIV